VGASSEKASISNATADNYGIMEFTTSDVPVGAEINIVEIYVEASSSLTDLKAYLKAANWDAIALSGRTISAGANPAASPGVITLTPLATEFMNSTDVYSIIFWQKNANNIWIHGARITYIL
jgi:hypothetical protein